MINAIRNQSIHSSNTLFCYGKELLHVLCALVSNVFWRLSNYKNKTHYFDNTIQFNISDLTESQLDIIVKIENIYLKYIRRTPVLVDHHTQSLINNSNSILNIRSIVNHPLIQRLVIRLFIFFGIEVSQEDFFLQELHSILNDGVCYGASVHLASFSATNNGSLSENFNRLNHTHIAYIQMLHYLFINMLHLRELSNAAPDLFKDFDSLFSEIDLPLFECQEYADFTTQCSKLVNALEEAIESFSKIKHSNIKYYTLEEGYDKIKTDLLKENAEQEMYVFSFRPKRGPGHAMVIDLKNFQFFDPNAGVYQFASKQELIEAVFNRVTSVYPQSIFQDSTWEFLSVKSN